MTINEYYDNYRATKKYPIKINVGIDTTINDFFNNCIKNHLLPTSNVLAWHNMLMQYIDRPNAIFWIRYYENGSKKSGRWNTRRGCVTKFSDGFTYVFVSNYDAHEILNMIRLGVTPDIDEFTKMMNDFSFPMHYDSGESCEESDICAYPNIGTIRGGILTFAHGYLAHINGVKSEFLRHDGSYQVVNKSEVSKIYPRGVTSDWLLDKTNNRKIRKLNYSLSDNEKELVKAHFLRFIDPLNYYVTPGPKFETNFNEIRIGEYKPLNSYMNTKFEKIYGTKSMTEFRQRALIKKIDNFARGTEVINIQYGFSSKNVTAINTKKKRSINQTQHENIVSKNKLNESNYIKMMIEYLSNPFTSFRRLETQFLGIKSAVRGGGFVSKRIINSSGFDKNDKGILTKCDFSKLINNASDERLKTLIIIAKYISTNKSEN